MAAPWGGGEEANAERSTLSTVYSFEFYVFFTLTSRSVNAVHTTSQHLRVCVCVGGGGGACVRACARARACVCVCLCVCECEHA